jgi:lipoprotein-releasing system ATP-binding protein
MSERGGRIEVKGLVKSFEGPAGTVEVLRGIDLAIAPGKMTAIVGESGVGKTTLLHVLGALDRPTAGTVTFDGEDVYGRSDAELDRFRNRKVGFVFQFHHLIGEFNALENAAMPALIARLPPEEARERTTRLLARLGVEHRALHRPGELSGGEQQRVAVARALVLSPSVVLADEPTGNLDQDTGERLFALLTELNAEMGITMVIVTHNERFARRLPVVIRMTAGRAERVA